MSLGETKDKKFTYVSANHWLCKVCSTRHDIQHILETKGMTLIYDWISVISVLVMLTPVNSEAAVVFKLQLIAVDELYTHRYI